MIPPEALCWLCKKPGCDAESNIVTVKEQPNDETQFVSIREEYYHRACLEELHKRLISLHEFRKIEARRKQALLDFRLKSIERGKE